MAATAAVMGAMANTLRLSLVDYAQVAPALAAIYWCFKQLGLLASMCKEKVVVVQELQLLFPSIVNYGAWSLHVSSCM